LNFELDILQTPCEIGHFNGVCVAVGGFDLHCSDIAHGRRDVHEKHGNGVLMQVNRGHDEDEWALTPARSAGIVVDEDKSQSDGRDEEGDVM
jgi:hypothetical protein